MNIVQELKQEFPSSFIDHMVRELARDIEQADGYLEQSTFRAKETIKCMIGLKYTNEATVKSLLRVAADYYKKSGMFVPLSHGFASKCNECACCVREKAAVNDH